MEWIPGQVFPGKHLQLLIALVPRFLQLLVLLVAAAATGLPQAKPVSPVVAGQPSDSVSNAPAAPNSQVEISLQPDKKTILLGEPMFLSFAVKNLTGERLCLGVGGDYRNRLGRPDSFKVQVTGDDGVAVPQPKVEGFGGLSGCGPIPANGTYVITLFLPHWATISEAGRYTVDVKRQMAFFDSKPKSATFPDPDFVLQADVSATFTVAPYDENGMGAVINSLGSTMLDIDNPQAAESAQALASIHDKRVISYFVAAVQRFGNHEFGFGNEYSIGTTAVWTLAEFDDDSAIAALEAVMNSPSQDTRLSVAGAFEISPHRSAPALLLKMQNDSYWFVRLRVAQGLSKVKTAESVAVLRKLLNDENKEVRKAAQDSLNTAAQP